MNETKKDSRFPKVLACLLPILFFCGGCATEFTHVPPIDADKPLPPSSGVYRGTRADFMSIIDVKYEFNECVEENACVPNDVGKGVNIGITGIAYGIVVVDLPLSAAADTILLPYDLTTIHSDDSNEDSDQ